MVRAVAGGIDTYIEDSDSMSPRGTITRDTRRIERTLIVEEEFEDDEPTYVALNALIAECFPLFAAPGRLPVTGSQLYVDSLDVEPFGRAKGISGGLGAYGYWKAKLVYTPLPYKPPDEDESAPPSPLDLLEQTWQGGSEIMTLPGTSMYWDGDSKPIGDEIPATKRILYVQHSHTRHHLEASQIPYAEMRALSGKVNRTDFASNHAIFPGVKAQTLLFENFNISYRFSSTGERDFRLTLNFKERTETYGGVKITWNHLWDRSTKAFKKVFHDALDGGTQTKPLYDTAVNGDFDELFGIT
jgi:hypothetical protein